MASTVPSKRSDASPSDDHVVVGEIVGVWGVRGDVKVVPSTKLSERFSAGSVLYLEGERAVVVDSHPTKSGVRIRLNSVLDRTQADALRGKLLTIPRSELSPLLEGSYYHYEIIGLDVWTDDGDSLGTVREVLATGSNDVYVVRDAEGRDTLVPSLEGVVLDVLPAEGKITVHLPEGLRKKKRSNVESPSTSSAMKFASTEPTLETRRLRLEPLVPSHASDTYEGLLDEAIYRFIPRDPPMSRQALKERYRSLQSRRSPDGSEVWLNWALRANETDEYVGTLQATVRADLTAEIAYVVFPAFWRQGYAREGCGRMLDFLFESYQVTAVSALIDTRNTPSIRLVESLGFARVDTIKGADFFKRAVSDEYRYEYTR